MGFEEYIHGGGGVFFDMYGGDIGDFEGIGDGDDGSMS